MKTICPLSVTVGIPTYECGESLVIALDSIYKQTACDEYVKKIIVMVDGNEIAEEILKRIQHPKLSVIVKKPRRGQSTRINDILSFASTDLVVLTNDDIYLKPNAVEELIKTYKNTHASLIAAHVKPLKEKSFLEKILYVSYEIERKIGKKWNNGDNYLLCNGRLICLDKRVYKRLKIPTTLHNNDAYIYFWNKLHKGSFAYSEKSYCFYRSPATLKEYINQSTKFQFSEKENSAHLKQQLKHYFAIPPKTLLLEVLKMIIKYPLLASIYACLVAYSRMRKYATIPTIGYWSTDRSTKKLRVL